MSERPRTPGAGNTRPVTDHELFEEQAAAERVVATYKDVDGEVYAPGLVLRVRESLRYVVAARNARAQVRRLQADREGLLGAIAEYLREVYPDGPELPEEESGARLEAAARSVRERPA